MKDVTAEIAKKIAKKTAQPTEEAAKLSGSPIELHRRYGQIGISAVAAAARYQGAAKNPAYAPAPARWNGHANEAA
jgi:hypothetical protein